jgi:hypothetical protein
MGLFRRRKPLHERLLEQAGVDVPQHDVRPVVGGAREAGVHGIARQREWDASLAPLADAVERELQPPYRARAVRQSEDLWAVAARAIEVVQLPGRGGDAIELSVRGGERTLSVDGAREFGTVPELESLAEGRHSEYVVRAERLDGDWWEVRVDPL